MAESNATVEIPDDSVVTVTLPKDQATTDAEIAAAADVELVDGEPKPEPKPKAAPRVRLTEQAPAKQQEEALAALQQTIKTQQTSLSAAEATAQAERRRADNATQLAAQKDAEAKAARESADNTELALITTGVDNATRELAAAEEELERALEAGEFKKSAQAQVKVSKAAAALDRLETAKANYEAGGRKTTEGRVEAPQQQLAPFEQYVSSFAPAAQAWLRAHPECVPANVGGNATSNAKMMKGHYAALAEGHEPNGPEYFRVIEETAGYRQPTSKAAELTEAGAEEEAEVAKPKPAPKRLAQPSAPPTREPPSATGVPRTTRTVSLTKEQQDAAKMSFPQLTPQQAFAQYARNLVELEAEGKLGRLTH